MTVESVDRVRDWSISAAVLRCWSSCAAAALAAGPGGIRSLRRCGRPVAAVAKYFSVAPTDVIVIHDEIDIDFGQVRLKRGGGEGGHNGLRSLSQALGTRDYLRVRIGIGRPPGRQDPADFVLKPFPSSARSEVELLIANGCDAVELLLGQDLESAQNTVHAW